MKPVLSERNLAILLFVMVLLAFSFAHEDSKKRDTNYNAALNQVSSENQSGYQPVGFPKITTE